MGQQELQAIDREEDLAGFWRLDRKARIIKKMIDDELVDQPVSIPLRRALRARAAVEDAAMVTGGAGHEDLSKLPR